MLNLICPHQDVRNRETTFPREAEEQLYILRIMAAVYLTMKFYMLTFSGINH
jgi:hypothetical protein